LDLKINRESQIVTTGGADTATPALGGGHGLVWVNTETHVYHKEGSRFYGTTKKGNYVSEADAIKRRQGRNQGTVTAIAFKRRLD
jgi:hypothetical protein